MKVKKLLFSMAKVLIITISLGYIIFKIYSEKQNGTLFYNITEFTPYNWILIFIIFLLMLLNWLIESIKFKFLISNIEKLSIKQSIKAVLTGITVSIFTPKRIGDFGGRILYLEKKNQINGVFATLLGSLSQLLVTLIVGSILFPLYISFENIFANTNINTSTLFPAIVTLILLALLLYLNISKIGSILNQFSFFKEHNNFILFLQKYSKKKLLLIILLSLSRYSIFTLQFFLLLWLFGVNLTYTQAIIGISQIYFIMVLIPTFALGELGVRGSLAVWILSTFSTSASGIIAASVLLWFINLAIPAIIGTVFLSKAKPSLNSTK